MPINVQSGDGEMLDGIWLEIAGSGPPVLLTHGFGDDASTWDALFSRLSQRYTVMRWDLPGHRKSVGYSRNPRDYEREKIGEIIECLIAKLREFASEGNVQMIGHSLGGYLSLYKAVREPHSVGGLVLIASGPGFKREKARTKWNSMTDKAAGIFGLESYVAPLCRQKDSLIIDNLGRLDMPILQICGSLDAHYSRGMKVIEQSAPLAQSCIIEDAKHHVHVSHHEEVANSILDFFAGVS
jgi:pimeloyl-ACP methyl ester carboxylesterase